MHIYIDLTFSIEVVDGMHIAEGGAKVAEDYYRYDWRLIQNLENSFFLYVLPTGKIFKIFQNSIHCFPAMFHFFMILFFLTVHYVLSPGWLENLSINLLCVTCLLDRICSVTNLHKSLKLTCFP